MRVNANRRLIKDCKRLAERQGWEVRMGGNGHWHFISPAGMRITTPSTPGGGNPRKFLNVRAALRKAGLEGL